MKSILGYGNVDEEVKTAVSNFEMQMQEVVAYRPNESRERRVVHLPQGPTLTEFVANIGHGSQFSNQKLAFIGDKTSVFSLESKK